MDVKEIWWDGMGWFDVAHNLDKWWVLLNTVMNFSVPYNVGISWLAEEILASEKGFYSMEMVS